MNETSHKKRMNTESDQDVQRGKVKTGPNKGKEYVDIMVRIYRTDE